MTEGRPQPIRPWAMTRQRSGPRGSTTTLPQFLIPSTLPGSTRPVTPRTTIVLAKFAVCLVWGVLLALLVYGLGLVVGVLVGLPPAPSAVMVQGSLTVAGAALLTMLLTTPVAFFAGVGRGYLAPMGIAIFFVVLAQVVAAAGWGEYFPWAIPALYAGMAGPEDAQLGLVSYAIVVGMAVIGVVGTLWWWERADHTG